MSNEAKDETGNGAPLTYAGSGVNYQDLDPIKVLGQKFGRETAHGTPWWLSVENKEHRRGDSAPVLSVPGGWLSHVEEGLGTKILMADWLYRERGDASGYNAVAQCTVAMIVNDMITAGIPPVSIQMHLAVGSGDWLKDTPRIEALMHGWKEACIDSQVIWTGGETPALKDIINPDTAVLAGSAVGFLPKPRVPFGENIQPGDKIIGIASSGVHANGISLVRKIARGLSIAGKLALYRDCLVPTRIYTRLVNGMIEKMITPSYVVHVTGHGWRKFMRAKREFTYRIKNLLPTQAVFEKIQKGGKVADDEMWGNYNMGTGFAFMLRPRDVEATLSLAESLGFTAREIGEVEDGPKRVIIEPVGITFEEGDMTIR